MDAYRIIGGKKLEGEIIISGAKNAALPVLAACILAKGKTILHNVPVLRDVNTMIKLLENMGITVKREKKTLIIDSSDIKSVEAPYSLVKTMRASFIVLGSLIARFHEARVSLPGGCAIGTRPVDIHIKALRELGAHVEIESGYVEAKAKKLTGNTIFLDFPSVGATENIMLAASLAIGQTIIKNPAKEPEIVCLADFINKMGGNVNGAGTDKIIINGVTKLYPVEFDIIPDRLEAGTFIIAAAITKGKVILKNTIPSHLEPLINKLEKAGIIIKKHDNGIIEASYGKQLKSLNIKTLPHPGFPTDMQPQMMALLSIANGTSIITENIFENRFMHVAELCRMGAHIKVEDKNAIIEGINHLEGAEVMCSDLRAGAALVLAALSATGKSLIQRIYHIERGYEEFDKKLTLLGANITHMETKL